MRSGLLIILLGIVYLLTNVHLISAAQLSILLPIIVIYVGIAMVTGKRCWHCGIWHETSDMHKKAGLCDCDDCSTKKRSKKE
jgi:hypothetical protein